MTLFCQLSIHWSLWDTSVILKSNFQTDLADRYQEYILEMTPMWMPQNPLMIVKIGSINGLVLIVVILFPEEYNITHSICTTFKKSFHKCIPLAVAREAEAHRADNRYFNNDTAGGKQGARGDILLFPDVSSTLHYQNEWFNINGSDIYL